MIEIHLPSHFYLKRRKWVVELIDDPSWRGEDNLRGFCDCDERLIELWAGLSPYVLLKTFQHEYMHAVEHEYGVAIPHATIYKLERPLAYMSMVLIRCNQPSRRLSR